MEGRLRPALRLDRPVPMAVDAVVDLVAAVFGVAGAAKLAVASEA